MIPSASPIRSAGGLAGFTAEQVTAENAAFMRKVYAFMSGGLGLTALVAWMIAHSSVAIDIIYGHRGIIRLLFAAQIVTVLAFTFLAQKMKASGAATLFFLYSVLTGITLSSIFLVYTTSSITTTFLVTAGTFGGMSIYGFVTKRDLSGVGHFMMMGLWGLIIASIANFFMRSETIYWVTTFMGVLVFTGLTAYDTQKIKELNVIGNAGTDEDHKEAIHGALVLYLDFINMFLYLLRLFGRRR